jgi:hypothetical protein
MQWKNTIEQASLARGGKKVNFSLYFLNYFTFQACAVLNSVLA